METEKQAQKRIRLDKKQRQFLYNVFEEQQSVRYTLQSLRIRPQTLRRWLTKSAFVDALEDRLGSFNLQSRIEVLRFGPVAAGGLGLLCSDESAKQESVRKACNDILKLQKELQTNPAAGNDEKVEKHGSILDKLGGVRDKHGGILNNFRGVRNPFGNFRKHFGPSEPIEYTHDFKRENLENNFDPHTP